MKEIKSDVLVDLVASRLQSKYENVGIRFFVGLPGLLDSQSGAAGNGIDTFTIFI